MKRIILVGKVLLVVFFLSLLLFVVKYADVIRWVFSQYSSKRVAGAETSFEKEIKKDVDNYVEDAKGQVMNIKVSDMLESLYRLKKISQDIQSAKEIFIDQIKDLGGKDKSK